jgi:P27 family predicted phage terminase small subunit
MSEPLKPVSMRLVESGGKVRGRHTERAAMVPKSGPMGEPPDYLTHDQRAIWRDLVAVCDPGLLLSSDGTRFEQLVIAKAVERDLVRKWNLAGCPVLVPGKRGGRPTTDPTYTQIRQIRKDIAPLTLEFGLNPLARQRVKVQATKQENPLDRFLKKPA